MNGIAESELTRAELARRTNRRLRLIGLISNAVGALIVFLFFVLLAPGQLSAEQTHDLLVRGSVILVAYLAFSLPVGRYWAGRRPFEPIETWLLSGRPAGDEERRLVLHYPEIWMRRSAWLWAGGALIFAGFNTSLGPLNVAGIIVTVLLGGLTARALQYLLVERALRPVTALALADAQPERLETPGVAVRLTMAWTLASGIALLAIAVFSVAELGGADLDEKRLIAAILFLAVAGLSAGAAATLLSALSLADSLGALRRGVERVELRDFEARVEVDDGSEVGLLQVGFNRMAIELEEGERVREALGVYVDPEIARHILAEGIDLAGGEAEVTILFVDIRDFTAWAERESAREVVATLNRFFESAVPIVHEHAGHVDKFVGDGLMAVFGVPRRQHDHADRALAAGLAIAAVVEREFAPEIRIGIGLSSGKVVVGNVGGGGRLNFSVIGDPVNVAARVEAATRETGDTILITAETKALLTDPAFRLERRRTLPLKGKRNPVALFAPAVEPAGRESLRA